MTTTLPSSTGAGPTPSPHVVSSSSQQHSTLPVEMSTLSTSKRTSTGAGPQGLLNDVSIPNTSPITSDFAPSSSMLNATNENSPPADQNPSSHIALSNPHPSNDPLSSSNNASSITSPSTQAAPSNPPQALITRLDSIAIGPATENPPTPMASNDPGPVLVITLLLTSGARHPYKIDEKYLIKRNVNVPGVTEGGRKDPFSISVYTLKELILREWREEWEAQPSSPSSIRLIFFGRLLDDKTALRDCRFNAETPNVVHMTVRPQDIVDEEDASKSKALARERDGREGTAGCRCVIL